MSIRAGINSADLEAFLSWLHESRYVQYVADLDLLFVWNGSLTINVYGTWTLREVDMFTLGHASGKDVTLSDVQDSIERYIARIDGNDDDE